jgi:selenocysteine-specific elongation factor
MSKEQTSTPSLRHYTIGTAGHVDHGKSALVWALTGNNPDRLKEEQTRGMSIELGYAFLNLPDLGEVAFIDVPGHERFLRTAVAGIWGIDLAMLVIAADEGPMPQTIEHLEALEYLGVKRGLVVLNKVDLVEPDWLLLMQEEVEALVKGTFLEGAPILSASAKTGAGLDELREKLVELLKQVPTAIPPANLRLPIDRIFTMRGFGTIAAGTIAGGEIHNGDEVELMPQGRRLRVRYIQTHNVQVESAARGQRTAVNLPGIAVEEIIRGNELTAAGTVLPTRRLGVRLLLSHRAGSPLKQRTRLRLHKGTAEVICRVVLLDRTELAPGESCLCHLRLEETIVAERYERFVVRGFSDMRVIGGGQIVDPYVWLRRRLRTQELERLAEVEKVDLAGLILSLLLHGQAGQRIFRLLELIPLTFQKESVLQKKLAEMVGAGTVMEVEGRYLHPEFYRAIKDEVADICRKTLAGGRVSGSLSGEEVRTQLKSGVDLHIVDKALKELAGEGRIQYSAGIITAADGQSGAGLTPELKALQQQMERLFDPKGFVLITLPEMQKRLTGAGGLKKLISYLVAKGEIVTLSEGLLARKSDLERAWENVKTILEKEGELRVADWKDRVNLSRKDATAILDWFVAEGRTVRVEGTHRLANKP